MNRSDEDIRGSLNDALTAALDANASKASKGQADVARSAP